MSKTALTKDIETAIFNEAKKNGQYGCFEVSIGFGNSIEERVDLMTINSKDVIRCYEIKITKSDFHSKNHNTFVGNYNYYVMPRELVDEVISEIPDGIGVYAYREYPDIAKGFGVVENIVKAKKRDISKEDLERFKSYLIRSMARDSDALAKSKDSYYIHRLNENIANLTKDVKTNEVRAADYKEKYISERIRFNYLLSWLQAMTKEDAIDWSKAVTIADIAKAVDHDTRMAYKYGLFLDKAKQAEREELYSKLLGDMSSVDNNESEEA